MKKVVLAEEDSVPTSQVSVNKIYGTRFSLGSGSEIGFVFCYNDTHQIRPLKSVTKRFSDCFIRRGLDLEEYIEMLINNNYTVFECDSFEELIKIN